MPGPTPACGSTNGRRAQGRDTSARILAECDALKKDVETVKI